MKTKKSIFFLWLVIFSLLSGLAANPAEPGLLINSYDLSTFPMVSLRLSAWDMEGLPLVSLKASDFTIHENSGGPAIMPDSVVIDRNAPLAVALVMDVSGSMLGKPLVDAQVAATRFLDRLDNADTAALIAFSDGVDPHPGVLKPGRELGFTANLAPVYDTIEALQALGGTHLYNALGKAVAMTESLPSGHRAILLLSDGVNEPADVGDPDAPIALAQENNLPIYVIGLGNRIDEPYLRRLASETGGVFRLAPSSSELAQTFNDMADLLKTQYTLTYFSQAALEGANRIDLSLTLKALGNEVSQALVLDNLPLLPTQTPLPTLTPTPLPPTATPMPPIIEVAATPEPPTAFQAFIAAIPWYGWVLGIGVFLGLLALSLLKVLRRARVIDKCANCGYILKNDSGPCPECGDTRRIKVKASSR